MLGSSPRQPTFLRCLRILERADRADVTATRGAEAGVYKGRAPGAGTDRERESPGPAARSLRASSAGTPGEGRQPSRPGLPALPEHPARRLPLAPAPAPTATMSSSNARALAVAVTILHLTRLVSWTGFFF